MNFCTLLPWRAEKGTEDRNVGGMSFLHGIPAREDEKPQILRARYSVILADFQQAADFELCVRSEQLALGVD